MFLTLRTLSSHLLPSQLVTGIAMYSQHFYDYCHMFATWSSSPSIVYKARLNK